ncbi:hypothetical protein [Leadbetterella sp. DM7]|uniref:hypothetical protein n=1 Tax=Leadbetterella sp. DM7 TaxID=3235085 RepID=UPI00349EBD96
MINIKKTDEYVIFTPGSSIFDDSTSAALEKAVAGLYSSEGRINFIVDLDKVSSLAVSGVILFDKVHKIALRESGLFVTVVNNDTLTDIIADNSQFELLMLSSVDEAIEAIYMNLQDNEYDEGEENEFGEENDY